ncbi:replicase [Eupatorium vein clearing virus]|uniref:replicase n=1 Tax=Eupatorium vein clearing virus TaxID=515444 RepID=UPI000172CB2E|nr:replicase [Eupatorium vein clearing virus]ACB69773.1 replicase [Eupatorium vein clearing virus]
MSKRNLTNPNSIYILGTFQFPGYKIIKIHCLVDTGASMCIASRYIIPPELWKPTKKVHKVKTANGQVTIDKVCLSQVITVAGKEFLIPTIYQLNTGIDMVLGNNFLNLYGPFIQFTNCIILHLRDNPKTSVRVTKVTKAYAYGKPGFIQSMKKGSKVKPPTPENISRLTDKIVSFSGGESSEDTTKTNFENDFLKTENIFEIQSTSEIEELLELACSENPLDPEKSKGLLTASIKLIDPNKIIRVKPIPYPPNIRQEFDIQIKELLAMNLIVPSKSPHMSPAFMVNKGAEQRRGKMRMVVNYKALNDATIGDAHNIPNRDSLMALISGKRIFSSFDCKSGFWQVLLDKPSQELTAFTCPQGHYQWLVMPFGLKQAPAIFQRHMQIALNEHSAYSCVYIDDILVFSENEKDHEIHVSKVLNRCINLGIILSKKKSQLFKETIDFLGISIDKGTHSPKPHILENIHNFPERFKDVNQCRKFLGIITYAMRYIPELSRKRMFLQDKLKKNVPWTWTSEDTRLLQKLKLSLKEFPKLHIPQPGQQLILETDASQKYWGGILKAEVIHSNNEITEEICCYASGTFKQAELNYHSNEKEILAVIRSIQSFPVYLTPVEFIVRTDNKTMEHFLTSKFELGTKSGRLVRWQMWFKHYNFKVEHIKGTSNFLADYLSREYNEI